MAAVPEGALMQRAAFGLATCVADFLGGAYGARVLLLIGSGDNGGDALFAGAMLARRGAKVSALLLADTVHEEGLRALRRAGGWVVEHTDVDADVVIDGIVGIGGRPGLRPDAAAAVAELDGVPVISVDTPSGVGVDDGVIDGPYVSADLTITFGALKPVHLLDPAGSCGAIELVDIGLGLPAPELEALQPEDVRRLLPAPDLTGHKYSRGVVALATGSTDYPGAAVLGVAGASTGLCGMVRYVGSAADEVLAAHPEVVVGEGRCQAWVVGSGGGNDAPGALTRALEDGVPVVVDADALRAVGQPVGSAPVVLTPHAGELAAMLGLSRDEVEAEPLRHARGAAAAYDCVVLLKGRRTVVAVPDGRARINTTGTVWLGTAGSGDVLAGLIGSLLAAGLTPYDAASVAAWLHGAAAQQLDRPFAAGELPAAIQSVLESL